MAPYTGVGGWRNATRLFITELGDRAVVSPRNTVVIRPRSEPQPDLLRLRPRSVSYSREHPTPEDVWLAVEVADTTVRFDRLVKARLYREPGPDGYASVRVHGTGQMVSPLAFPGLFFAVADFFV